MDDSLLYAFLLIVLIIGAFLLWRIPIGRRIKSEEEEFIRQHIKKSAIFIFKGSDLRVGEWQFKHLDLEKDSYSSSEISKIRSYYGGYTLAFPPGEYNTSASFDYNYANGIPRGAIGYTRKVDKVISLQQGCIYRYRMKHYSAINKKLPFTILFEETVAALPSYPQNSYIIVLDQIINNKL